MARSDTPNLLAGSLRRRPEAAPGQSGPVPIGLDAAPGRYSNIQSNHPATPPHLHPGVPDVSDPELARLRRDLDVIQDAAGFALPFGWRDVWLTAGMVPCAWSS